MPETTALYDPDAEKRLLAYALQDIRYFDIGAEPTDFHDTLWGQSWATALELLESGDYANGVNVPTARRITDVLEHRGVNVGLALEQLEAMEVNFFDADIDARKVRELAAKRRRENMLLEALRVNRSSNGSGEEAVKRVVDRHYGSLEKRTTATVDNPATWADMARVIGPVSWDWPGYLPSELLSLFVGDSGAGKSIFAMRIVGTYTCGWPWPDNTPYTGEAGKVLWCESEAAQAVNLERATAWGIPLENVLSPFTNPLDDVNLFDAEHLAAIARVATRDDVRLVIVDSLSGATGGKGKGEDLMPIVKWLAELARDLHKPVLVLHHLRKRGMFDTGETVTLDRVRDSTVIIQPSRVVWAIDAPNGNEPEHKRLSVIKSNLGKFPPALGLHIGDDGLTFDDAPQAPKVETQIDKAKDLLKSLLDRGPMASIDLESEARGAGISWDTMKRAKDALGVVARRDGKAGKWYWALSYGQEAEQEADA